MSAPTIHPKAPTITIADRFHGLLPVVVDVETAGFNSETDALLEIAAIPLQISAGRLKPGTGKLHHIEPFPGANLDPASLEFIGIDPFHPFRFAVPEREGLQDIFAVVSEAVHREGCKRAILVGHNPSFDLAFIRAATRRCKLKAMPFHTFSCFDTATLGAVAYRRSVLSKAVQAAGLSWDSSRAHSALYDAERTAELFCTIVNRWDQWQHGTDGGGR